MSRTQRKSKMVHEVALRGRRHANSADNSLRFFARIEGEYIGEGRIRGANGIRWRVA